MPKPIIVNFNLFELGVMWFMATRRQGAKSPRAKDKRSDKQTDDTLMHYIGIKGEWAVAKYLRVFPDIHAYQGGDDGKDLVFRGHAVEVKNSRNYLIFNSMDHFRADLAVLVNPHGREADPFARKHRNHWAKNVQLRGWIPQHQFARIAQHRDFGYGDRLYTTVTRLYDMQEIWKL